MKKTMRNLVVVAMAVGSAALVGCNGDSDATSSETNLAKVAPPKGADQAPKEVKYQSQSRGHSAPSVLPGSAPKAP